MNRETDIKLLQAAFDVGEIYYDAGDAARLWPLYIPSGKPWKTHHADAVLVPRFADDAAAMRRVEDQIQERHRTAHFTVALLEICGLLEERPVSFQRLELSLDQLWTFAHATLAQRHAAALVAFGIAD